MRVLWNFGQNASNDQEGQQQGAQSRVPVSPVDEVGRSDPQEKAEPGGDPQPDTGKEADSKTTRGGNKAPLLRTQKIKAAKEGGGVEHPIKKKAASASKDGRLKTTGLEKAERRTRSQARCSSPRPASRKRRAVTTLYHQRKVNSVASSTKPAKMVSSTNTNNSNARRLTSGGTDNERSGSQWRYYDVRQVDEDVRQDPDDPVEEPPELLHAENNPESARGDTLLSPTSFANRAVGLASEGAASTSNSVLDARLGDSSSGPTSASVAVHDDFAAALKKRGLEIQEQDGDGNCLFRAISLQVYGDASMHGDVRKKCMDFMVSKADFTDLAAERYFEGCPYLIPLTA
jgi:OTU-like cysteine protease